MATELKIPNVGESISEVQISEWLKAEGDELKTDDPVAVIDSEKTTFELPSPADGRLAKILRKAGDTVKIGETVAQIELESDEEKGASRDSKPKQKPKPGSKAEQKQTEKSEETKQEEKAQKDESEASDEPAPKEEMEETPPSEKEAKPEREETSKEQLTETDENSETETGAGKDREPERRETDNRETEVVPMTMLRRTVARRLVEAQQSMAMLTTFTEVDMSAVQSLRREHAEAFQQRYKVKLGFMSFFVKAAIDALKQYPKLNAEIRDNDVVYHNYFDIGVAIASERGLVVPVLRNAERMSFAELESRIGEFAQRARDGKLKPKDLEDGTFTITNGGVFGSLLSTPIINPPQTGILGMHAIQERPVAVAGEVVVRPMMFVALSYDHRLIDGREAVLSLRRINEAIENPARMLIEI